MADLALTFRDPKTFEHCQPDRAVVGRRWQWPLRGMIRRTAALAKGNVRVTSGLFLDQRRAATIGLERNQRRCGDQLTSIAAFATPANFLDPARTSLRISKGEPVKVFADWLDPGEAQHAAFETAQSVSAEIPAIQ